MIFMSLTMYVYTRNAQLSDRKLQELSQKQIENLELQLKIKTEQLSEVRKNLAKDFHDEMGNKLASINILSQAAQVSLNSDFDKKDLVQLFNKIAINSRDIFQGTKDFIWSIDYKSEYVYEFFIYIRDFGEQFFQTIQIDFYSKSTFDELSLRRMPLNVGRQLVFICKEIMTNAAKHSHCKKVSFVVSQDNNNLKIEISDNGNGFDINSVNKRGLNNIFQRSKDVGIDLSFESNPQGTSYYLSLKLETIENKI